MTTSLNLVALAGSLRKESYNQKLIEIAVDAARKSDIKNVQVDVQLIQLSNLDIPLYSQDLENTNVPSDVIALKQTFARCHGMFIASPEYNGSISGVLKNTIDWLSRPLTGPNGEKIDAAFAGKVAGVMATSPGALGGLRGLAHLKDVLFGLGCIVNPTIAAVGQAGTVLEDRGVIQDEQAVSKVQKVVHSTLELTLAHASQ